MTDHPTFLKSDYPVLALYRKPRKGDWTLVAEPKPASTHWNGDGTFELTASFVYDGYQGEQHRLKAYFGGGKTFTKPLFGLERAQSGEYVTATFNVNMIEEL